MRCLTLARRLNRAGMDCTFACVSGAVETVAALRESGLNVIDLPEQQTGQLDAMVEALPRGIELLVVDNYGLDGEFEAASRPWARAILAIDDLADRWHDADLLVDQTFGRTARDYRRLVPDGCRLLTGTRYALLRPEFAALRGDSIIRRRRSAGRISRVLVSFGSSDPKNLTWVALEGLRAAGFRGEIDVVLGGQSPNRKAIADAVETMSHARLVLDAENIAEIMLAADLAIGAGGTTSWERCCLGLPTIVVIAADNQRFAASKLAAEGAIRLVGDQAEVTPETIADAFHSLMNNPGDLKAMSERAAAVCDGLGSERLEKELADWVSW